MGDRRTTGVSGSSIESCVVFGASGLNDEREERPSPGRTMHESSKATRYPDPRSLVPGCRLGESVLTNPLRKICTVGSVRGGSVKLPPTRRRTLNERAMASKRISHHHTQHHCR